ncbi:MAG: alpha/beta hydrolase [Limisphaerales bacterium]
MNVWNERSRSMLMTSFLVCTVLCACGCAAQRRLLYVPTKLSPEAAVQEAALEGFIPWKNASGQIIGWKIPANGASIGSVLIVHGNAGCAINRGYLARPIHEAVNADVFILEYPGYGAREGSPSKKSFDAAAGEAFQLLPANAPRYIVSESIGTGVACDLAKEHPMEIAGMALFAPYHNLASVAQHTIWFLPSYFLLLDRFNPEKTLKSYHGPVKFVVAGEDEVISPASGIRLFKSYAGPKDLQIIAGARHNDVAAELPEWWKATFLFWKEKKAVEVGNSATKSGNAWL